MNIKFPYFSRDVKKSLFVSCFLSFIYLFIYLFICLFIYYFVFLQRSSTQISVRTQTVLSKSGNAKASALGGLNSGQ